MNTHTEQTNIDAILTASDVLAIASMIDDPSDLAQHIREKCYQLHTTDAAGIYIPQIFAQDTKPHILANSGISDDAWPILQDGPDNEHYWDAWNDVIDGFDWIDVNGTIGKSGHRYGLDQDGDLWLVNHTLQSAMLEVIETLGVDTWTVTDIMHA